MKVWSDGKKPPVHAIHGREPGLQVDVRRAGALGRGEDPLGSLEVAGERITAVFVNNGTYNRNVTGTTYFDTAFNNNGTLNLQQGDIQVRQGGAFVQR